MKKTSILFACVATLVSCKDAEPFDLSKTLPYEVNGYDVTLQVRVGSTSQIVSQGQRVGFRLYKGEVIFIENLGIANSTDGVTRFTPADGRVIINTDTISVPKSKTIRYVTK